MDKSIKSNISNAHLIEIKREEIIESIKCYFESHKKLCVSNCNLNQLLSSCLKFCDIEIENMINDMFGNDLQLSLRYINIQKLITELIDYSIHLKSEIIKIDKESKK